MKNSQLIQQLHSGWHFHQIGKMDWYPAIVPGCVHLDLLTNDLIEDPFYRDNETKVQWIEKVFWEYELNFNVTSQIRSKRHIQLVFEGLDTYATVILNDEEIVHADNMFHQWQTEVSNFLNKKNNKLLVRFRSPILEVQQRVESKPFKLPTIHDQLHGTSPYTRKAPYHYQWDWGPRLVTSGIWQPVKLEAWDNLKINDVYVITKDLNDKKARVELRIEVLSDFSQKVKLKIYDDRNGISITDTPSLKKGVNTIVREIEIKNPQIWWPNGYGEQPLYTIQIEISNEQEIVTANRRVGLRTLKLNREEDQWGQSFTFVVNGIPIFAKGTNWIPADNFTTRVSEQKYRYLLTSAAQANMNMVRVWGGGIYESDFFYDLCDQFGLLVWQDFMFACSLYPADDAFLSSVRKEATYQVRRLRSHPCLALWCGNNEIEAGWQQWGWKDRFPDSVWNDYAKLFNGVLAEVCQTEDPERVYWQSSPGSDIQPDDDANDQNRGDTHYWGVWHEMKPFESYMQHYPRFISEYGFQSFPEPITVDQFTTEEDRDIFSPVMLNHQRSPNGNSLIKQYMDKYFQIPKKFDHFILLSQILQAEAVKLGTEHFRRIRPRCMGSLYWQLNDCWPAVSWASIDYYGRWKALHYYAKRFFAPILLSPCEESGAYQFYVISDYKYSVAAELQMELIDFNGQSIQQWTQKITIQPLASKIYFSIGKRELDNKIIPQQTIIYSKLKIEDRIVSENALYFLPPKHLNLTAPQIMIDIIQNESDIVVSISAKNLVRSVILAVNDIQGHFEDNFFDLYPGQERKIRFITNDKIDVSRLKHHLSYLTLFELMGINMFGLE